MDGFVVPASTEKFKISTEGDADADRENPPRVNLYYSYVSQSGSRTPIDIPSERDDSDVLDKIKYSDTDARRIELRRVVSEC